MDCRPSRPSATIIGCPPLYAEALAVRLDSMSIFREVTIYKEELPSTSGIEVLIEDEMLAAGDQKNQDCLRVVVHHGNQDSILGHLQRGYSGAVSIRDDADETLRVIQRALEGRMAIGAVAQDNLGHAESGGSKLDALTPRERELAIMCAEGKTTDEIAAAAWISPHTVRTHLRNAYGKLGVASRAQFVIAVLEAS